MAQNLIEKIAQRFAEGLDTNQQVHSGDFITLKPAHVMTHDNTGAVIPKFRAIGASKLANPRQVVHTLDHNIQDTSEANKQKYARIEAFSAEMGADFYPAGRGIGHQIMCEEGYAWPGTVVLLQTVIPICTAALAAWVRRWCVPMRPRFGPVAAPGGRFRLVAGLNLRAAYPRGLPATTLS